MKFCCFLMMMSGWLPPCHEGAADCRPDRFLLSVSSCPSSVAHLHASSLLQRFSVSRSKGFPESCLVASWLTEHGGACVEWGQLVNPSETVKKTHRGRRNSEGQKKLDQRNENYFPDAFAFEWLAQNYGTASCNVASTSDGGVRSIETERGIVGAGETTAGGPQES